MEKYMPAGGTFWDGYHLMDFLEVAVQFVAVLLIARAVQLSVRGLRQSEENNNEVLRRMRYASIDELYFEINKLAIQYPYFRMPQNMPAPSEENSDPQGRYGTFALVMYNFIETIHDTVNEVSASEKIPFEKVDLWDTWSVIADVEARRHKKWLLSENNIENFKPEFVEFLKRYIPELK